MADDPKKLEINIAATGTEKTAADLEKVVKSVESATGSQRASTDAVEAARQASDDLSRAQAAAADSEEAMAKALGPITEMEEQLRIAQAARRIELEQRTKPAIQAIKDEATAEERLAQSIAKTAATRAKNAEAQLKELAGSKQQAGTDDQESPDGSNPIMRMGRGIGFLMVAREMIKEAAKVMDDAYTDCEKHGVDFAGTQVQAFHSVTEAVQHPIDSLLNFFSGGVYQQLKDLPKDMARAEEANAEIMQRAWENQNRAIDIQIEKENHLLELQYKRIDAIHAMNAALSIKEEVKPDLDKSNEAIQAAGVSESSAQKKLDVARQKQLDVHASTQTGDQITNATLKDGLISALAAIFNPLTGLAYLGKEMSGDEARMEYLEKSREKNNAAQKDVDTAQRNVDSAHTKTTNLEDNAEVSRGPAISKAFEAEGTAVVDAIRKALDTIGGKYAGMENSVPGKAVSDLRDIVSDGKITDDEMGRLLDDMQKLNANFFASNKEQRAVVNEMMKVVITLADFYKDVKSQLQTLSASISTPQQ